MMTKAAKFFYDNAGFAYDPKVETEEQGHERCAKMLAEAEALASAEGCWFDWQYDHDGCIGCDCGSDDCACSTGEPHEVLWCAMREGTEPGLVLASLGSICNPTREYRRVVEAELALEAMATLEARGAEVRP